MKYDINDLTKLTFKKSKIVFYISMLEANNY